MLRRRGGLGSDTLARVLSLRCPLPEPSVSAVAGPSAGAVRAPWGWRCACLRLAAGAISLPLWGCGTVPRSVLGEEEVGAGGRLLGTQMWCVCTSLDGAR